MFSEQDKMKALKMKLMGPEELQKILDLEMKEFEAGQDSNLLDASVDIANLQVVLKVRYLVDFNTSQWLI